jgi:hypothetical protein
MCCKSLVSVPPTQHFRLRQSRAPLAPSLTLQPQPYLTGEKKTQPTASERKKSSNWLRRPTSVTGPSGFHHRGVTNRSLPLMRDLPVFQEDDDTFDPANAHGSDSRFPFPDQKASTPQLSTLRSAQQSTEEIARSPSPDIKTILSVTPHPRQLSNRGPFRGKLPEFASVPATFSCLSVEEQVLSSRITRLRV